MSLAILAAIAAASAPPPSAASPAPATEPTPQQAAAAAERARAAAALAQPAQVRLSGISSADPTLARDVLKEIRRFAASGIKCGDLTAVALSVQPPGWQPADPNYRIGPAGTRYERWEAVMCGQTRVFLIGFWTAPEGGTQFQVGYPFPAEAPPAKAPAH